MRGDISTTETELLGTEDKGREQEARAEDIRRLWPGFEKFRRTDVFEEVVARREIERLAKTRLGLDLGEDDLERSVEAMMVFLYGCKLAQDLYPGLTAKIPRPRFKIVEESKVSSSFSSMRATTPGWKVVDTWFEAVVNYLLTPESHYTEHIKPWKDEGTKTVSKYLPDIVVVDLLLAGTEEYAHELLTRIKSGKKLGLAYDSQVQALRQFNSMRSVDQRLAEAIYHTGSIERRGLVWQQRVLEKYFPHWVKPTREFVGKVKKLRLERRGLAD